MKKLWLSFAAVLIVSFSILGWIGTRIYQEMPPIPDKVVTADGTVVIPSGDVGRGQNVWQSLGGMEVGSIWGHGSYVPRRTGRRTGSIANPVFVLDRMVHHGIRQTV